MADFFDGMRHRRIAYVCQMNPEAGGHERHEMNYDIPLTRLGKAGMGPKTAWVEHPRGNWPSRPGFARLNYEWARDPLPWQVESVNLRATKLLLQANTVHGPRSRPLGSNEMVLGYAWLVYDPGAMCPYFTLRAEHYDEVKDYIVQHHEGDYDAWVQDDRIQVFPEQGSPAAYKAMLDYERESIAADLGMTLAQVDAMNAAQVEAYSLFPVEARMRWA